MIIDSMFVYHFVDPDLRVQIIFRKEGTVEIRNRGYRHLCTLVLEVEENFMQSLSVKKNSF